MCSLWLWHLSLHLVLAAISNAFNAIEIIHTFETQVKELKKQYLVELEISCQLLRMACYFMVLEAGAEFVSCRWPCPRFSIPSLWLACPHLLEFPSISDKFFHVHSYPKVGRNRLQRSSWVFFTSLPNHLPNPSSALTIWICWIIAQECLCPLSYFSEKT